MAAISRYTYFILILFAKKSVIFISENLNIFAQLYKSRKHNRKIDMTNRTFLSITIFFTIVARGMAQYAEEDFKQIVDSVYAKNPEAVGFLVHVEMPDKNISWSYAVGLSNKQTSEKLLTNQPVLIASNTKPYVAATILRLVEQGKLNIEQPIEKLISEKSANALLVAGYSLKDITVKHLLSHTSGIRDYVDDEYFSFINTHPKYNWTRDEQIARAAKNGIPLAEPGGIFNYADVNFVLLTEVIETFTKKPFYESIRTLLAYKEQHLDETWFVKLEEKPKKAIPLAHQYWDERGGWDTYDLDPSWDLYGGGGIASTIKDMAMFFQKLFEGDIIKNKLILSKMVEDVPPDLEINYCLGIRKLPVAGFVSYSHGGGLGTDVVYIPELNASIAVASLEASHRPVALEISREIAKQLSLR